MSWVKFVFRPKHFYRELEEVRRFSDEMTAYAESLETQFADLQAKCETLQEENDLLRAGKSQVDEMATQLLSQLAVCRRERDEYFQKFTEAEQYVAQVDEIARMVDRFGEVKQNYELRIARLKEKLADARLAASRYRKAAAVAETSDDIVPLDFASREAFKEQYGLEQQQKQKSVPDQVRPAGFPAAKTVEVSQPSLFVDDDMKGDSIADDAGDWLRRLPDDLD